MALEVWYVVMPEYSWPERPTEGKHHRGWNNDFATI